MTPKRPDATSTRQACLDKALAIIGERGLEALSLREVARRLGLSHQAPYKHFASRDHLLAELVETLYAEFAAHLDDRPAVEDPFIDLGNMGVRYLDYAFEWPLRYRLLFGTPLPSADTHPGMMASARHAFEILESRLAAMPLRPVREGGDVTARADAFFIWSTLHGIASILHSDATLALRVSHDEREHLVQHMFDRIGAALRPANCDHPLQGEE